MPRNLVSEPGVMIKEPRVAMPRKPQTAMPGNPVSEPGAMTRKPGMGKPGVTVFW